MAIPQTFFNLFPTWIGVYGLTSVMFFISIFLFYNRVIRHIVNSEFKLEVAGVFLVKLDVAAKILENSYIVEYVI